MLCCCMVDSGVHSTQTCIRCMLGICFSRCLVMYGHFSILWLFKVVLLVIIFNQATLRVPVYQGLLPLLYEGVMEEDHSLVMVADILGQSLHFQYGLASAVCYTILTGHLISIHKYLDLISTWSLKRRWPIWMCPKWLVCTRRFLKIEQV